MRRSQKSQLVLKRREQGGSSDESAVRKEGTDRLCHDQSPRAAQRLRLRDLRAAFANLARVRRGPCAARRDLYRRRRARVLRRQRYQVQLRRAAQRGTARRAVSGDVRADQADHRGDQRPRQWRRAGTGALLRYPGGRRACAVRSGRGSSRMASRRRRHAAPAAADSARPRARDALHRQPNRRRRGAPRWDWSTTWCR